MHLSMLALSIPKVELISPNLGILNQDAMEEGYKSIALFFLIFARLVGVFVQAPLFGKPKGVAMPVQIGYSLAISLVMYHVIPPPRHLPMDAVAYAFAVVGQVGTGLIIGFASYMVAAGMQFAGEMLDTQLGISIAASIDASAGGSVSLLRQFEFRIAMIVWILIHGDFFLLRAVRRSYDLIPPDVFLFNAVALNKLIEMSGNVMVIGLEISSPILIAIFITDVALGLLNRASQAFNVFMISFPVKVSMGLTLLIVSLSTIITRALPNLYAKMNQDIMVLILALASKS